MLKVFDIIAWLFYCAVIYWLSDQSSLPVPMLFEFQDKLHHFGAYFIMAVLAWSGFRHFAATQVIAIAFSVLFCSLFGVTDEWHQSFVEGRTADVLDWLADTLGALTAGLIVAKFLHFRRINS